MQPISGHFEPIHVKFGVRVLLSYGHENAETQQWKFDDITLQYSVVVLGDKFWFKWNTDHEHLIRKGVYCTDSVAYEL